MADEISPRDLLNKLDGYHAEIVNLARETTSSVETLKQATEDVKKTELKFWNAYKTWIVFWGTLLVLLGFIIGVAITMSHTDLCVVNVGDSGKSATITSCKNVSNH